MLYSRCLHCDGSGSTPEGKCKHCDGGIVTTAGSDDPVQDEAEPQPKPENVMADNLLRAAEQAVRCQACGKLHPIAAGVGEDAYFTFHGNVTIGASGGIIGNNLDEEGRVVRVMVYCRKRSCLQESFLKYILPDEGSRPAGPPPGA